MEMKKEIPGNETKENNGSNTYYFSSAKYPGETVSVHWPRPNSVSGFIIIQKMPKVKDECTVKEMEVVK